MISRRRFLGASALQAAAAMGLNSVSLKVLSATPTKPQLATAPLSALERVPIVLIGSGYGNAVTALRLTEKGHKVVMLEMGQLWNKPSGKNNKVFSPTLFPDDRCMWNRKKTKPPVRSFLNIPIGTSIRPYAGALGLIEYSDAMQVYVGHGVGGGSLVNGAMAVTPPEKSFREVFSYTEAQINVDEMYGKYYPLANKTLEVNYVDKPASHLAWFNKTDWYQFARVSRDQAIRSGYKTVFVPTTYNLDYMIEEDAGTKMKSALDKEVIFGNNAGKQSLDKTYIADAFATGNLSIYALQEVVHIEQEANGDYLLLVLGRNKYMKEVSHSILRCGALFIGAGSCGTSELLVRARDTGTLPKLNAEVGQGWGNNGNIMGTRYSKQPTGMWQSTMPLMGIDEWDDPVNPVFCEITPLPVGVETFVSMYLAITKTKERSFFKYVPATGNTGKVVLQWTADQTNYSRNSIKKFLDKINDTEGTLYCKYLFDNYSQFGDTFCYHPLGGCILGKATDNYGRVKGYSKLYVTDGSLIPGLIGVNPFVTITALAERNIERVLAEDKFI